MKLSSNSYYVATLVLSLYGLLVILTFVAKFDMYNITFYGCKDIINNHSLTHEGGSNLTQSLSFDEDSISKSNYQSNRLKKILIIAYPRTGSSLLGEIVSASANFSYFFEPLHSLRKSLVPETQVAPVKPMVTEYIRSLLSCETQGIKILSRDKFITKKSRNVFSCSHESSVVIKTIRMTGEHVREFIRNVNFSDRNSEVKIIHLVRDPRAVLASMYRQPKAWIPYLKTGNGTILCDNMIRNKIIFQEMIKDGILTSNNFAEVNYDLWMEETWGTIVQIYQYLQIPLTMDIVDRIQAHFSDEVVRKSYLSTFQGSDHDKDQWRTQLSQDQQRYIEEKCGILIENETENYEEISTSTDEVEVTTDKFPINSVLYVQSKNFTYQD